MTDSVHLVYNWQLKISGKSLKVTLVGITSFFLKRASGSNSRYYDVPKNLLKKIWFSQKTIEFGYIEIRWIYIISAQLYKFEDYWIKWH